MNVLWIQLVVKSGDLEKVLEDVMYLLDGEKIQGGVIHAASLIDAPLALMETDPTIH